MRRAQSWQLRTTTLQHTWFCDTMITSSPQGGLATKELLMSKKMSTRQPQGSMQFLSLRTWHKAWKSCKSYDKNLMRRTMLYQSPPNYCSGKTPAPSEREGRTEKSLHHSLYLLKRAATWQGAGEKGHQGGRSVLLGRIVPEHWHCQWM
jgi:hypothetical protein